MYLSTKFINKFKDEYATFTMVDPIYGEQSTYSAQGLDIDEYLEAYTSLVKLEGRREKLVWNKQYIPEAEFISQLGNINTQIDEIAKLWKL